ncbi:MAG: hypothetical protein IMF12_02765 [Proteobacteria bacterium]|nr:hypothetical protein [Pseudomonadota bacterium]
MFANHIVSANDAIYSSLHPILIEDYNIGIIKHLADVDYLKRDKKEYKNEYK